MAYGPSGCGKSVILSNLLQDRFGEQKIVRVNCRLLSTVQDLLWTIQTTLSKHFMDVYHVKKLPVWKLNRVYSVIDLANFLRSVISIPADEYEITSFDSAHYPAVAESKNDNELNQSTIIHLFLDDVSHIVEYETVFATLSDLSRISERRFQLFATMEVAPNKTTGMIPSNFVHFPPYSQEQLRNIVSRLIATDAKWPLYNNTSNSNSDLDAAASFCQSRLYQLLLQSMETLSLASTSVDLLCSAVTSLWTLLFDDIPSSSYRKCRKQTQKQSELPLSAILPSCGHALVKRLVQEMIRRNRFNFYFPVTSATSSSSSKSLLSTSSTSTNRNALTWTGTVDVDYQELRQFVSQSSSAASSAATATSASTSTTNCARTVVPEDHLSSSTLVSLSFAHTSQHAFSATSVLLSEHIQSLPYHLRVMLVAGFLAGTRGKQQDALYDPSSQTFKRRRHSQANNDTGLVHESHESNGSSHKDMGTGVLQNQAHGQSLLQNETHLPNRELFTYERLSALYAHVLTYAPTPSHHHHSNPSSESNAMVTYAKPTLQSLVTRLEMYGLLQAMPGVLPTYHPLRRLHCGYRANIAKQVAFAAAENIGFPLESFMYNKYDFNQS